MTIEQTGAEPGSAKTWLGSCGDTEVTSVILTSGRVRLRPSRAVVVGRRGSARAHAALYDRVFEVKRVCKTGYWIYEKVQYFRQIKMFSVPISKGSLRVDC